MKGLKKYLNLLPPSAAMAGIYTRVDNTWCMESSGKCICKLRGKYG